MAERALAIAVRDISKTYRRGSKSEVQALRKVRFDVRKGEIVGLIGPNGAGKTTLLRLLLGFLDPDPGGEISIFGRHPESLEVRSLIGYQADSQFRSSAVSVTSFLTLHAKLLGAEEPAPLVEAVMRAFNLLETRRRSLGSLSKGMRQKVELALAFVGSPRLVFLDEPTASLDPPSVFELRDFLASRKLDGMTVFFSSHNLTEVEHVCDRVHFIHQGTIVADYDMAGVAPGFLEEAFRRHVVEREAA